MKRIIVAAALAVASFVALVHAPTHAHAAKAPVVAQPDATALESPVVPSAGRDAEDFARVGIVEVPEITIVASVPTHHAAVETDAAHMARLMATPLGCGDMHDNWVGGRNADCR